MYSTERGQIGNAKEWYDQLPSRQQNRTYQEARKVYERDFDAHFPLSPSVHESSGSSEAPSSEDSYEKEDRREGNRERRGIQTWLRYRRDHPRAFGYRPRPTPIQPFNFMGLPVEIRCEILRLLLERDKLLTDISPNATYESYKMVPVDTCLFAVSRQMHADAQAVFFRSNTFRVRISGIGILGLPFFIEYPPPSTEDFRKFHLSIFHHSQPLTQPRLTERLETVIDMLKECKQLIQLKILQFGDHSDFTKIPQNIFEDSLEFFTQVQGVKQVILSDSEPPNDDYYSPIVAPEKVLTRLETIMQSPKAEQGSIVRKRFLPLEKRLKRG